MSGAAHCTSLARQLFRPSIAEHVSCEIVDITDAEEQQWVVVEAFMSPTEGRPPHDQRTQRRSARVKLSDPTGRLVRQTAYEAAPRDLDVVRAFDELAVLLERELRDRGPG